MIGFDKDFEKQCGEYLEYLYYLAEKRYNDCPDIDTLVQDTLAALIVKISLGESIEYPKGFLSAVLKNKYNVWLREKYKAEYVEYFDGAIGETYNEIEEKEKAERKTEEYEAVRREIGRLIGIYREVTVRHYVHGQTVEQISKELGIPRGTVSVVVEVSCRDAAGVHAVIIINNIILENILEFSLRANIEFFIGVAVHKRGASAGRTTAGFSIFNFYLRTI